MIVTATEHILNKSQTNDLHRAHLSSRVYDTLRPGGGGSYTEAVRLLQKPEEICKRRPDYKAEDLYD